MLAYNHALDYIAVFDSEFVEPADIKWKARKRQNNRRKSQRTKKNQKPNHTCRKLARRRIWSNTKSTMRWVRQSNPEKLWERHRMKEKSIQCSLSANVYCWNWAQNWGKKKHCNDLAIQKFSLSSYLCGWEVPSHYTLIPSVALKY